MSAVVSTANDEVTSAGSGELSSTREGVLSDGSAAAGSFVVWPVDSVRSASWKSKSTVMSFSKGRPQFIGYLREKAPLLLGKYGRRLVEFFSAYVQNYARVPLNGPFLSYTCFCYLIYDSAIRRSTLNNEISSTASLRC